MTTTHPEQQDDISRELSAMTAKRDGLAELVRNLETDLAAANARADSAKKEADAWHQSWRRAKDDAAAQHELRRRTKKETDARFNDLRDGIKKLRGDLRTRGSAYPSSMVQRRIDTLLRDLAPDDSDPA